MRPGVALARAVSASEPVCPQAGFVSDTKLRRFNLHGTALGLRQRRSLLFTLIETEGQPTMGAEGLRSSSGRDFSRAVCGTAAVRQGTTLVVPSLK